ncbi:MAG TPA: ABC transporter permease [Ilumatobacteraceae bacterium]|nr:ABC transporter permease [Ilumatobacteraceae bacterium]
MTVTETTSTSYASTKVRLTPEERRERVLGGVYFALAAFVFVFFALDPSSADDATFNLSLGQDRFDLSWTFEPRLIAIIVAVSFVVIGILQLAVGFGRWTNMVLGFSMLLFVIAFLGWAAGGQAFSLVGMLSSMVVLSIPITCGGLTGLMCERVAVINIGIEGQLLSAAFVGTIVGSSVGTWGGLVGAMAIGALLGFVLAVLVIKYQVDQIIAGVVINIFALGLTSFLSTRVLGPNPQFNSPGRFSTIAIPVLEDIPVIGPMFFQGNIFLYGSLILVFALHYGLFYTRWGLRSRAVGEHPKAADTVGINVYRVRYRNVTLAGLIAGFGGAALTLGSTGRFEENMTAGVGFIGLAAMIAGRWRPFGVLGAALVFGFARAMQQKLGILGTPIPSEFLAMAPYILTIVVVAGLVGRARPPAADGQPYVKE